MKIKEFNARITKIIKFIKVHRRIMNKMKIKNLEKLFLQKDVKTFSNVAFILQRYSYQKLDFLLKNVLLQRIQEQAFKI